MAFFAVRERERERKGEREKRRDIEIHEDQSHYLFLAHVTELLYNTTYTRNDW